MTSHLGYPVATEIGEHLTQQGKRINYEERRPRVSKASDLLGPLSGPKAVMIEDLTTVNFNGWITVPPGTPGSPDPTKWWTGTVVAGEDGGSIVLSTYKTADEPHQTHQQSWTYSPSGAKVFSEWESLSPRTAPFEGRLMYLSTDEDLDNPGVIQQLIGWADRLDSPSVGEDLFTYNADGFSGELTVHRPGYYTSKSDIYFSSAAGSKEVILQLNGTSRFRTGLYMASATGYEQVHLERTLYLNVGDKISVACKVGNVGSAYGDPSPTFDGSSSWEVLFAGN